MKYKTIGILGGMGPEATAELYLRIIRIFQKEYEAKYDDDFPEIVILNLPIPDVVENPKDESTVETMLMEGARKLEIAGADFIIIPCNTVNFFLSSIEEAVSISVVNLLREVVDEIKSKKINKVALLGTEATINKNIYRPYLTDVELFLPRARSQKIITRIIMNILAGKKTRKDKTILLNLIEELKQKGAEKVILGCTELPILITENQDTIDTIDVLAKAAVREAVIGGK